MMNVSLLSRLTASALVLGCLTTGCKRDARPATASAAVPRADAEAARTALAARGALAANDPARAVTLAEAAVALQPRQADYRALLGQAYLAAGRFASAATSLRDARTLDPAQARAGLNLALAKVALGDRAGALAVLATIRGEVDEADRGLALALAGDTEGAVHALDGAARTAGADARTRQNLALAHALAGQWGAARTIAAQDLAPDMLEQRMRQWARFSQPGAEWQQVATLLNVVPAQDHGMPVALALAAEPVAPASPAATAVAVAAPEAPIMIAAPAPTVARLPAPAAPAAFVAASPVPAVTVAAPEAPVMIAMPAPAAANLAASAVAAAPVEASAPAPRVHAVATPITRERIAAFLPRTDMPARAAPIAQPAAPQAVEGRFVIQLGAYSSAARVEAGWRRKVAQFSRLAGYTPASGSFVYRGTTLHRLTLAGFGNRAEASSLCGWLKTRGGDCFVRAAAGERIVRFTTPDSKTVLAMR